MERGTRPGRRGLKFDARHLELLPMACCGSEAVLVALPLDARAAGEEVLLASRIVADGVRQTDLSAPAIHCGACIRTIEKALGGLAGVESARVNLSTRRVTVLWRADEGPPPLSETVEQAGVQAQPVR